MNNRPDRSLPRNDPCACGSGRKQKRCCGDVNRPLRAPPRLRRDVERDDPVGSEGLLTCDQVHRVYHERGRALREPAAPSLLQRIRVAACGSPALAHLAAAPSADDPGRRRAFPHRCRDRLACPTCATTYAAARVEELLQLPHDLPDDRLLALRFAAVAPRAAWAVGAMHTLAAALAAALRPPRHRGRPRDPTPPAITVLGHSSAELHLEAQSSIPLLVLLWLPPEARPGEADALAAAARLERAASSTLGARLVSRSVISVPEAARLASELLGALGSAPWASDPDVVDAVRLPHLLQGTRRWRATPAWRRLVTAARGGRVSDVSLDEDKKKKNPSYSSSDLGNIADTPIGPTRNRRRDADATPSRAPIPTVVLDASAVRRLLDERRAYDAAAGVLNRALRGSTRTSAPALFLRRANGGHPEPVGPRMLARLRRWRAEAMAGATCRPRRPPAHVVERALLVASAFGRTTVIRALGLRDGLELLGSVERWRAGTSEMAP